MFGVVACKASISQKAAWLIKPVFPARFPPANEALTLKLLAPQRVIDFLVPERLSKINSFGKSIL